MLINNQHNVGIIIFYQPLLFYFPKIYIFNVLLRFKSYSEPINRTETDFNIGFSLTGYVE